jgi:two-component system response regulator RegX3
MSTLDVLHVGREVARKGPDGLAGARILLVEDPCPRRNALRDAIGAEGFDVTTTAVEPEVLGALSSEAPDLVLLDLSVNEARGLSICRKVREKSTTPIIVIAAAGDEARILLALEMGANDYLTRPLEIDAVMARVRTVLIRASAGGELRDTPLEVGPLFFRLARREVRVRGEVVHFPKREYELLLALVLRSGHIRTRTELMDEIWGHPLESTKTLDAHMVRIRRKIEVDTSHPRHIITVRGVGYYFDPSEDAGSEPALPATRR